MLIPHSLICFWCSEMSFQNLGSQDSVVPDNKLIPAVTCVSFTVRRWKDVSVVKSPELQMVLLEGMEKEGSPTQTVLPLPADRCLSHRRWRDTGPPQAFFVFGFFIFCHQSPTWILSAVQHSTCATPRLPHAVVRGGVGLHPGLPEDDWRVGDTGPSSWPFSGCGTAAAAEETAATLSRVRRWWTTDEQDRKGWSVPLWV